jgi:hypothetical protein
MPINQISGGTHNHYYNLTQAELDLQTKSEMVSVRFYPKEIEILKKHAQVNGQGKLSNHIRKIVIRYLKTEPGIKTLQKTLDDIFG